MKKGLSPNGENFLSKNAHLLGASPFDRLLQGKTLDQAQRSKFLAEINSKLNEGFAVEAEARCFEILENYQHSIETQAEFNQLLSVAKISKSGTSLPLAALGASLPLYAAFPGIPSLGRSRKRCRRRRGNAAAPGPGKSFG